MVRFLFFFFCTIFLLCCTQLKFKLNTSTRTNKRIKNFCNFEFKVKARPSFHFYSFANLNSSKCKLYPKNTCYLKKKKERKKKQIAIKSCISEMLLFKKKNLIDSFYSFHSNQLIFNSYTNRI